MGSSVIEPCGRAKVHSPSQSSVPVTLIAGTWNRCSIASRVGTALSVIAGPNTARQPSSTNSPYASMTAFAEPLGSPSTSRKTSSTGRSIIPFHACSNTSSKDLVKIVPLLFREAIWKKEVAEVTQLDRLRVALVGHGVFLLLAAFRHHVEC